MKDELAEAIEARDKFLEDKPHLKEFQNKLDELLDKVPEERRLEVIHQLACGKMMDLNNALGELTGILSGISKPD